MNMTDKRALVREYLDAYNAFDMTGMLALLTEDVRFENYFSGELSDATRGIDEFRALAERAAALFSKREQRIVSMHFVGTAAVVDVAFRGHVATDIPGGPGAGTVVDLDGVSEFHFDHDKIAHIIDRS